MSDIFISYSRDDAEFVEALIVALIEYGWSVWSDRSGMSEGRPFDQQIENAIADASVTLVIWSKSSVKSRWVRAEAAFALDKEKLVPVIADNTDPPLQFLHIQSVNLAGWNRTTEDVAFKKLAVALSRRLDRVGRIPEAENEAEPAAKPKTSSSEQVLAYWKIVRDGGLPAVGPGFGKYFADRTFFIAQFACALSFCMVTAFGLIDLIAHSSVEQTLFRMMVTGPSLLILLALSFMPFAKRHSQKFAFVFGVLGLLIVFRSSQMIVKTFPTTTGAATTTFLVLMMVYMVLPLRTPNAIILALLTLLAHEVYITWAHTALLPGLHVGYSLCVLCAGLLLIAVTWFRERLMRANFLDNEQATAKIAELKDRLLTLAAQRNQPQEPAPNKPVREKKISGRPK